MPMVEFRESRAAFSLIGLEGAVATAVMSHFTLQIGSEGPVLNALIGVSQARAEMLTKKNQPVPNAVPIRALVDTGASCTCIDPVVFAALGLTPTGSVAMFTPSTGATPHQADQYDVSLLIPPAAPTDYPFILGTLQVTAASDLNVQGIQALIGRDILTGCVLTYNGAMRLFTLAF